MLFNVFKAVLARGLFAIHGFVSVWRVVDIRGGDPSYWLLTTSIGLLVCEGFFSICKRRGREMKWFCPSVFFYLCCIIPPTWIMELDLAQTRKAIRQSRDAGSQFVSRREKLSKIPGLHVAINLELPAELWAKVLEQFLLVNLIIGRWLLPKGDLTRGQLSQLLLVYIGMAADIVELFEAFKEDAVSDNVELTYAVLALWSWSLMQFTLVLTATKARKPRLGVDSAASQAPEPESGARVGRCPTLRHLRHMDTWAILTTILFQDGPFLCLRLLLITKYNVVSYLNIFFTCKNSLVLLLQMYRMTVVSCEGPKGAVGTSLSKDKLDAEIGKTGLGVVDDEAQWSPPTNWNHRDRSASRQPIQINRDGFTNEDERRHVKERLQDYNDDLPNYVDLAECECAGNASKCSRKTASGCRHHLSAAHSDVLEDRNRDSVFVTYSQSKKSPWGNVYLTLSPGSTLTEKMNDRRTVEPVERCCNIRPSAPPSSDHRRHHRSGRAMPASSSSTNSCMKKNGNLPRRTSGFGDRKCSGRNRMRSVTDADWLLEHCFREESACASTRF